MAITLSTYSAVARMLGAKGERDIDRELLVSKADELEINIQKLTAMRGGLRHAAESDSGLYSHGWH